MLRCFCCRDALVFVSSLLLNLPATHDLVISAFIHMDFRLRHRSSNDDNFWKFDNLQSRLACFNFPSQLFAKAQWKSFHSRDSSLIHLWPQIYGVSCAILYIHYGVISMLVLRKYFGHARTQIQSTLLLSPKIRFNSTFYPLRRLWLMFFFFFFQFALQQSRLISCWLKFHSTPLPSTLFGKTSSRIIKTSGTMLFFIFFLLQGSPMSFLFFKFAHEFFFRKRICGFFPVESRSFGDCSE